MFLFTDSPGGIVPQFMNVSSLVQSLSEKTPRFNAVMPPEDGIVWLMVSKAVVVTVRVNIIMMMMNSAPVDFFGSDVVFPPYQTYLAS